jgi:hypothetical protein
VRRRPGLGTRNHQRLLNVFPRDMLKRAPISTILSEMLHAAGAEPLTLHWLLGRMGVAEIACERMQDLDEGERGLMRQGLYLCGRWQRLSDHGSRFNPSGGCTSSSSKRR